MIFVDTSAWIALLDGGDGHHSRARAFSGQLARGRHGRLVTSDYVLDETVNYLRRRADPDALVEFRAAVEKGESVQIVWTDPVRFWGAWDLLASRHDKYWSLTDCVSFLTMESLGIRKVFGFDADFEQAGFSLLPGLER